MLSLFLSPSFSPWLRTIRCIRRRAHYKTGEYKRQRWVETDPPTWSSTEQASSSHPAGNLLSSYFNISRNSANTAVFPILLFLLFFSFFFFGLFRFVSFRFHSLSSFLFFFLLFSLFSYFFFFFSFPLRFCNFGSRHVVEIRNCCISRDDDVFAPLLKIFYPATRIPCLCSSSVSETAASSIRDPPTCNSKDFERMFLSRVFFELQIPRADIFIRGRDWSYVWILFFTVSGRDGHRHSRLFLFWNSV